MDREQDIHSASTGDDRPDDWLSAQEVALARVWDNDQDAVYDHK